MRYFCGIDIGASSAKLAIVDATGQVVGRALRRSGVDYAAVSEHLLADALAAAQLRREDIARSVSTGYGRDNVPWAHEAMTEITCHAKGAWHHFRRQITVIDIGAQDSKVIHLDANGKRVGFKMNRKCAAGTGAFLEEIALRLALNVADLNELAEQAKTVVSLGSFCTVFAATEILSKIRAGEKVEAIVKGAFHSVVKRLQEMDAAHGDLVMTGGVAAHNPCLVKMFAEAYGRPIQVPPDPQLTGAFGAALLAREGSKGILP
ncbi:MAG: acyl-CoA dehydratase activase [Verrucomicrobia bacterium]|nr:acyl-CoA dehydratase activase [Verrucomicrobiota bacterium]